MKFQREISRWNFLTIPVPNFQFSIIIFYFVPNFSLLTRVINQAHKREFE